MEWSKRALKYDLSSGFDASFLPKSPGVYIFQDDSGKYLYVGKAKSLRNRVSSYFRQGAQHAPKTALMLKKARYLDIVVTASEREALILEAELIGELKPRYNIRLRDDKAYPFLKIGVRSPFPRISLARKRQRDGAIYFGPYTSAKELRRTLDLITTLFGIRTCTDSIMKNRSRPCLKFQVGKCSAPCTGQVTKDEYQNEIKRVRAFLGGKTRGIIADLKKEMEKAAQELDFERAALLRDRIQAIEGVVGEQVVVSSQRFSADIIFLEEHGDIAQAAVLKVREGILREKHAFGLEKGLQEGGQRLYSQFLRLYYSGNEIPREVVLPDSLSPQVLEELGNFLTELKGREVLVRTAKSGVRRRLLDTARLNAVQTLGLELSRQKQWDELSKELKSCFQLKKVPYHVEGVDISNTSGLDSIGSLVCFKGGKSFKAGYRHYNLSAPGPDDYAMIHEVVMRRLKSGISKEDLPDLLIIDGGKGQLSMALQAAKDLGVEDSLDLISIAKDRGGEGEKIYLPGVEEPLFLARESRVLRFCQRVRDEAHRFGLMRHRKKRSKKTLTSHLDNVPGIGPKRRRKLLEHFGSVRAIKSASLQEIESVPGLPKSVARALYNALQQEA
ncbi:MAG: excinuclease ABC subunit UvrC [Thermodesulfobacteria bacterium]|nr:excinuclease ABC subunit UvrC [Thermodesulfobacteriota bacterium]